MTPKQYVNTLTHPREYRAWYNMIQRCTNPNAESYRYYGGKGIKVCEKWKASWKAFFEDMGPIPFAGYELDRIDSRGDYEPKNCRWVDPVTQRQNTSKNVFVEYRGQRMNISSVARLVGMSVDLLAIRLRRGWSIERATQEPKRRRCEVFNG